MKKIFLLAFVVLSSALFVSCEKQGGQSSEDVNKFANTRWSYIYNNASLSCRLNLYDDGFCDFTYYEDEYFGKVQSTVNGKYYVDGNKIEFSDNLIIKRVPPKNGQNQYIHLISGKLDSSGRLTLSIKLRIENRSWSSETMTLSQERW